MSTLRYAADSDELREAIVANCERHQFLGAGAGAGKTTTLVSHYFGLLERGFDPTGLVAVTFTRKAAAEMKQRLREQCRERAQTVRGTAEATRWEGLLHELETAPITTIDSLCQRFLRENALLAGLDPDFAVLDEVDAQILLDEVVRRTLLARLGTAETADTLAVAWGYAAAVARVTELVRDRAQLETVLGGPCYDTPTALLQSWAAVERELLAAELQALLGDPSWHEACAEVNRPDSARVPDDDKLRRKRDGVREQLRLHGARDWTTEAASPDTAAAVVALAEAVRQLEAVGNAGSAKTWGEERLQTVRAALRVFLNKDGLLQGSVAKLRVLQSQPPEEEEAAALTCALVAEVRAAATAYAEAKSARGEVDFSDLLLLTRDLWQAHPEALQRTRRTVRHLMVDEFQDTNRLQKEVLWPLVADGEARLFVVGDAKQSIYRFRSADVTVFNQTREEMRTAASRDDELTRNFRSTEDLIEVFNQLFRDPAVMGPPTGDTAAWEATYEQMQHRRGNPPTGQAPLEVHLQTVARAAGETGGVDEGDGEGDGGDDADLHTGREREATWLARRVVHLLRSGECRVQHGKGADAPWEAPRPGDIAVLFRSLTDVALYERALRDAGLPYYLVVGRGFYSAQEVVDVAHVLQAIENGLDDIALVGALRSPLFGLSDETLYRLGRGSQGAWWWRLQRAAGPEAPAAAAAITGEQRERLVRAAALLRQLQRDKNRLPLSALVQAVLDRTGLTATLAGQFGGSQLVSNVRKLVELAGTFEAERQARGQSSLRDFIEHLKRMTTEEVREGQAPVEEEAGDSIKLITYHSAKGLQWPIVIAPDLCRKPGGGFGGPLRRHRDLGLVVKATRVHKAEQSDSFWPPLGDLIRERNEEEERAEDRRLLYVAATRAQDLLILSGVLPLKKDGGAAAEAERGALGWINEALGGPLWQPDTTGTQELLWRWQEGALVAQESLPAAPTRYERPAAAAAPPPPAPEQLLRRLAPVPPAVGGQRRFTATELSRYAHCPRRYELELQLGLPGTPPSFEGPAEQAALSGLELGTVVHQVLQLVGSGGLPRLDELVPEGAEMLFLNTLLDERAAREATTIRRQVRQFIDSELYRELFCEGSDLRSEAGIACLLPVGGEEVVVEGKIDALLEDAAGRYHLLDYKTGEHDAAAERQYGVQLGLYCRAVEQAGGRPPASARLVYLSRQGLLVRELNVAAAMAEALAQATAAVEGIWRGDFPRREGDCGYCPGRGFCHPETLPEASEEQDE